MTIRFTFSLVVRELISASHHSPTDMRVPRDEIDIEIRHLYYATEEFVIGAVGVEHFVATVTI